MPTPVWCGCSPVSSDARDGLQRARVVELREAQPVRRQPVEVRRLDLAAVAAEVGEAHVVVEDQDDVRACWSSWWSMRSCRCRVAFGRSGRLRGSASRAPLVAVEQVSRRGREGDRRTASPSRNVARASLLSLSAARRRCAGRGPRVAEVLDQLDACRACRVGATRRRSLGRTPSVTLRAAGDRALTAGGAPPSSTLAALPGAGEQVHRRRADEAGDASVHRLGEDLARRADLDDAPVHEHRDAVGERHRLFLVVRHVDGGDAERALQLVQARGASRGAAWRRGWRAARRAGTAAAGARSRAPAPRAAAGRPTAAPACGRSRWPMPTLAAAAGDRARDLAPPRVPTIFSGKPMFCATVMCG